ncbi:MAG: protein-L-isoaspartate(D-aspartate) O-methyltransferase [Chloroflexi bacterium]|nr:MAG: protein-L-isoaspartate(D-aspartate) O-methyltransferase [Chloroflexota bacterium]
MEVMDEYTRLRTEMVAAQIARRGLRDPRLLAAFQQVQRHLFLPQPLRSHAYEDRPLPIGQNQTISQPYIVALMTSLLELKGEENVLEIGTGSGYQAAILSIMARTVHSVERYQELADAARARLVRLGYYNVQVHCADGSSGWPQAAPYQAIIATAAAAAVPQPLLEQLVEGGRLVLPIGGSQGQVLQLWTRESGRLDYQDILPVSFVPMRGEFGWSEDDWRTMDKEE